MFDEFFEYEAMTFALGGDLECPDCGMGILIPVQPPSKGAQADSLSKVGYLEAPEYLQPLIDKFKTE